MIPKPIRAQMNRVRRAMLSLGSGRACPVCGWTGRHFLPSGIRGTNQRLDARCPSCGSLERHRLAVKVFEGLDLPAAPRTLHVAPEPSLEAWVRAQSADYLSIDLENRAMRHMDLTDLELDDASYSLVWCSNVLEHIPEDRKAMGEMFRVLEPGGIAFLQVPIWRADSTYEDPSIVSPEDRLRHFYQWDHVRLYGLDFADRLRDCGFRVDIQRAQQFGRDGVTLHGLSYISTNEVFVCTKP